MAKRILLAVAVVLVAGTLWISAALLRHARPESGRPSTVTSREDARPQFDEVAARAGLSFRYENCSKGRATILEAAGSGCAICDFDGDGWPDIYLLNGRDVYGRGIKTRNALYHNNGDGTFTDVTGKAGVPGTGYGLGVAVADFDNDGYSDIYVCQWGQNVLYHNNGNGTFTDVTKRAGVAGLDFREPFHTGAVWFDYDRDGRLDLLVCGYVKFRLDGLRYCTLAEGVLSSCPPSSYDGTPSILYHNNGDGTFTNVTKRAGVYFPNGKALSALTCDFDDDGWTDVIVGNDGKAIWLLRNNHDGTFTDSAAGVGIAFAEDGATMAAMGIDLGDYLNEGHPGFFVSDFSKRPDHLWRNQHGDFFAEVSGSSRIGDATYSTLGFGGGFLDYDNDGWLDLFVTNGHVYPEVDQSGSGEHYLQPNQIFHNARDGTFREMTTDAGPAFRTLHSGRGAAFGDVNNDGSIDILVNNNNGPPTLLINRGTPGNHFLTLELIGVKSNRDAIGTRVWVTTAGLRQLRDVKNGGSYLSCNDERLHFGLGKATVVDKIEVRWASGLRQEFASVPAGHFYSLREGSSTLEPRQFRPPLR